MTEKELNAIRNLTPWQHHLIRSKIAASLDLAIRQFNTLTENDYENRIHSARWEVYQDNITKFAGEWFDAVKYGNYETWRLRQIGVEI